MKRLVLALLLALAVPASAENYYEYIGVVILEAQTCTSPCEVEWHFELRGVPLMAIPKQCLGEAPIVRDRFLTVYFSGSNLPVGQMKALIGDNHPGRTQTYCMRLLYLPVPE